MFASSLKLSTQTCFFDFSLIIIVNGQMSCSRLTVIEIIDNVFRCCDTKLRKVLNPNRIKQQPATNQFQ